MLAVVNASSWQQFSGDLNELFLRLQKTFLRCDGYRLATGLPLANWAVYFALIESSLLPSGLTMTVTSARSCQSSPRAELCSLGGHSSNQKPRKRKKWSRQTVLSVTCPSERGKSAPRQIIAKNPTFLSSRLPTRLSLSFRRLSIHFDLKSPTHFFDVCCRQEKASHTKRKTTNYRRIARKGKHQCFKETKDGCPKYIFPGCIALQTVLLHEQDLTLFKSIHCTLMTEDVKMFYTKLYLILNIESFMPIRPLSLHK